MRHHVVETLWQKDKIKQLDQLREIVSFRSQGAILDLQFVNYRSCLSAIVQGTRGLMVSAAMLGFIAILVEMVGMRCTTCMAEQPQQKDKVALGGGVIFLISGQSLFGFGHDTLKVTAAE